MWPGLFTSKMRNIFIQVCTGLQIQQADAVRHMAHFELMVIYHCDALKFFVKYNRIIQYKLALNCKYNTNILTSIFSFKVGSGFLQ
jgi:hypothetical protein